MIEIIGIALLFALVLVAAVAYLFVYYFRYRWQVRGLEEENRRLVDQVYQLQQENEQMRRALELRGDSPKARGRDLSR